MNYPEEWPFPKPRADENLALALPALREAKKLLKRTYVDGGSVYVCSAIMGGVEAGLCTHAEGQAAIDLVQNRLGDKPVVTLWLRDRGCLDRGGAPYWQAQAYRHAWLDSMIKEAEDAVHQSA